MGYAAVREVETELLQRRPGATPWQVRRLLYLSQGFHLAWAGPPLFGAKVEAWMDGPVVAHSGVASRRPQRECLMTGN
jgi:uncharacterized phage-associated protein